MTTGVNASIAKGAIWMVALRFCVKGISIISIMILARLLTPEDFGLMALASSIYIMVELIRAFGFSTALIQKQDAERAHYDTAWTMQIIFALLSSSILYGVSDIAADYYSDDRLIAILEVLSVIIVINGFNNIGVVEFRKQMTFNREFKYQLLIKLSGFFVTIPLAWYLQSYWALLMGMLSGKIVSLILSYAMQNYRPKITLVEWRSLLGFSSWLLINNILFFINNYSHNFILGKLSGANVLGLYSISNEVATMTTNEIVAPINSAALPGYAKIAHDKEKLKESYLKVLSSIIIIAVPSAVGIAAIAPIFVPVLLGEKWVEAIPVIQLIALGSIMTSMNTNSGYIYLALAKQKITTALMCFRLVIFLPLLYYFALEKGAVGAAFSTLVVASVMFPINLLVIKRQLKMKWGDFLAIMYRPLLASFFMGTSVQAFVYSINDIGLISLLLGVTIGVITFLLGLLLLWCMTSKKEGIELSIFNKFKKRFFSKGKLLL
ncbi:MAG: lipopolysaccharide biosynthesis protein [Colwellia sp.]|nr:lipopolysaccharide biosynthesis protein [Colwellia sp.]